MKSFYTNGTILTMEDDALYAEAVCVENGRIKAVVEELAKISIISSI